MKNVFETTVMYGDTDAYSVVWHGGYLRFLERGRYNICKDLGVNLDKIDTNGITFPVVDMHVRFKSPAVLFEEIEIETEITELKSRTVTFSQTIKNKKSGVIHITAEFVCCAVGGSDMKLTKFPTDIYEAFSSAIN